MEILAPVASVPDLYSIEARCTVVPSLLPEDESGIRNKEIWNVVESNKGKWTPIRYNSAKFAQALVRTANARRPRQYDVKTRGRVIYIRMLSYL